MEIQQIVWWVFVAIVVAGILGLLWYAINYCEKEFPSMPLVWKVVRVVFVLLVIFMLICALLALIGKPLIRF